MLKVSIITVSYNSADTIRDTIESVISQNYPNIEYIVIDGASKDKTLDIVREYEDQIAIVRSEPDKGIYDAMNKGIHLASGDIVGILNSDDIFASNDVIERVATAFDNSTDGIFADLVYVDRENTDRITRTYKSDNFSPWKIRFGMTLPHPTFYIRRSFYTKLGLYKLTYRVAADFELIARFIKSGLRIKHLPMTLVKMREGGISSSELKWRVHQNFEIVRACRENKIYTNILLVAFKIPFKLLSYVKT